MKVMVTGSSGYIGSTMCKLLKTSNSNNFVIGVDCKENTHKYLNEFYYCDINDKSMIANAVIKYKPDAIFHFAASADVSLSVQNPALFYENNIGATSQMMHTLIRSKWSGHFIFSSTAAVYGIPKTGIAAENDLLLPINPYGQSKLMCEIALADIVKGTDIKLTQFRYFNVCGAWGDVGDHVDATHIIPRLCHASKSGRPFTIYGKNYHTKDGTCVRDYIHVRDVCRAHLWIVGMQKEQNKTYNLGSGKGYSNAEVVEAFKLFTGQNLYHTYGNPRSGDPAVLIAEPSKFMREYDFHYEFNSLEQMITSSWEYYNTVK